MEEKNVPAFIKKLEENNYGAYLVYKFYPSTVVEEMESVENVLRFLTNFYIENNQRIEDFKNNKIKSAKSKGNKSGSKRA